MGQVCARQSDASTAARGSARSAPSRRKIHERQNCSHHRCGQRHRPRLGARLLKAGYSVVLAGRRRETARGDRRWPARPANALAVPTDVADPRVGRRPVRRVKENFGRLDLLFNNAGGGAPRASHWRTCPSSSGAVVAVNLTGAFLCAQDAFRIMKAQRRSGGRIINNGSISAHAPRPHLGALHRDQARHHRAHQSISLDGRQYDIACGQIDIGNAATTMTARMTGGVPQANGTTKSSRAWTSTRWPRPSSTWPACRWMRTSCS